MKIPYGTANFEKIRRDGYFYVDKTTFLPGLESSELGYNNLIFLRPRRFGKSALVSMMEHYYDLSRAGDFDALFRGLWVHDHPTPEKNSYLVLNLNFSRVASDRGVDGLLLGFYRAVRDPVDALLGRYAGRFPALDRLAGQLDTLSDPEILLGAVMTAVEVAGQKLYLLIDEYDTFSNALLSTDQRDLYSKVTDKAGFVRSFYRTIKVGTERGVIGRVFVTGASPILLDDLMTGFNIVTNISLEPHFNTLGGFTRVDVTRAVDELLSARPDLGALPDIGDRAALLDLLERWYDGYRFSDDAEERVFNPDMVLYFLQRLSSRQRAPAQMLDHNARTDYRKLYRIWAAVGPAAEERRAALETILSEGHVWSELVEQFGQSGPSAAAQFVSLLYYTGMLTLSPEPPRGRLFRFELPNRVIRELGWEHFTSLLADLEGVVLHTNPMSAALHEMATRGDIDPLLSVFRSDVLKALGLKDTRRQNEKAMKMLLMGAIIPSSIFHVLSEKELAQGYAALFLCPLPNVPDAKYAWMLELKYLPAAAEKDQIDGAVLQAEGQLRRYASDERLVSLLSRGKELKIGTLVFLGCKDMEYRPLSGT